jgi:type I restriction-modification system DNA methylase subunit
LGVRGAAWADFVAESERLNKIYNGIIFKPHFIDRADFIVDERVFAGVRERLAHTNTVYNFNYIPIHVLGSIYERFLGKVIVATDKRARVEEKPEVRKAGGVYYTPAYIVRYIVEQTIGRLIEGKTPEEIALMRFADIACGSGSFLLGVYDELLRYHTAYYNEPKNRRKALKAGCIETADGSLRLSLNQRKDILLNNIYGVDLDAQAVEVAQLSLFLKLLEDETTASAKGFQLQFRETMLPSLDKNVIHGNSLIGWDISSGLFDDEEERKLVPMDFEQAFPEVMRRGGFDAIVGNPPYGQILDEHAIKYTQERIPSFKPVKDVYVAFMERAPQLLKDHGKISFIVPSAWLGGVAYKPLRETIGGYKVEQVVALPFDVFKDAYVDTLIFIITKTPPSGSHVVRGFTYPKKVKIDSIKIEDSQWNNLLFSSWLNTEDKKFVLSEGTLQLIERFKASCSDRVGDFLEMKRGVLFDKTLLTDQKSAPNSFPYFEGDVYRYQINLKLERWIEYGANMREYPKEFKWFEGRRILMRRLVNRQQRMMSCIADETFITNKNLYTLLTKTNLGLAAKFEYFALGILNSSLISKLYLDQVSQATKDDFPQVTIKDVLMLPMPTPDHARHDRMVNLVEQMLASKRQLQTVRTDSDRNHYENKCAALDRQIDALVYELYELTPDEIAIVENV